MRVPIRSRRLPARQGVLALCLGLALCGQAAAQPADGMARERIELPAGTLEDALNAFARRAGITLSFDPALVRGRASAARSVASAPAEGLAALLAPHGLQAQRSEAGGYLVRPGTPQPAQQAQEGQLAPVMVEAEAERAEGPVNGYAARRSATANRIDTALAETPRAVSVVSRAQIEDQGAQTVGQSLRYTAGVLTEVAGYDPSTSAITVRGFSPAELLDGFRLFASGDYAGWQVEPQGLERVELLKGPGSALYGQGAPGGVLNLVSKRPTADAVREVGLTLGSHARRQGSVDFGGAIDEDGRWTYRLNGLLRDSGGQTDFSRDDRQFLAPALRWKPSADTSLTLLADITRDRVTPKSWWPDYALVVPNPHGRIPPSRSIGEPAIDRYDRDTASLAYLLEHRIDARWSFHQKARLSHSALDYAQVRGTGFAADRRTVERSTLLSRSRGRAIAFDNSIEGRLRHGDWSHVLQFGADQQYFRGSDEFGAVAAPSIDAFSPVYGAPVDLPRTSAKTRRLRINGFYVQDQMRSERWTLDLALRHDRGSSRYDDYNTTQLSTRSHTSYNLGVLYRGAGGWSPYLNQSSSFMPVLGADFNAAPLRIDTGRQFELGLKYQPPGTRSLYTVSAFELTRRSSFTGDQRNYLGLEIVPAVVRARGLEFEARLALGARLRALASYTWLDARVLESIDTAQVGKRPRQSARHSASLWLDYRFAGEALAGWSLGAGVRYVGRVPARADNAFHNPAYTLVDVALRHDRGPWSYSLNATNLFDRTYVSNLGQAFGQRRTLQARAVYRW